MALSDRAADLATCASRSRADGTGRAGTGLRHRLTGEDRGRQGAGDIDRTPQGCAGWTAWRGGRVIGFCWSRLKRDEQDALPGQAAQGGWARMRCWCCWTTSYVEGSSNDVARTDAQGNTYEDRDDDEGERVELPKNYPTDSALRKRLANAAKEIRVARWEYFWVLTCRLK
jgi:hypothetical protein